MYYNLILASFLFQKATALSGKLNQTQLLGFLSYEIEREREREGEKERERVRERERERERVRGKGRRVSKTETKIVGEKSQRIISQT